MPLDPPPSTGADPVRAWAECGAMGLTGPPYGPGLGPPAPMVERLYDQAARFAELTGGLGRRTEVDPLTLLTERAAIAGLTRRGGTSCGGGTRLMRAADGWMAVTLARDDDITMVPAWLELDAPVPTEQLWSVVDHAVSDGDVAPLVARGAELGLPVAALGEVPAHDPGTGDDTRPWTAARIDGGETATPTGSLHDIVVADLGSLWAGPLCTGLLAEAGARVLKVESTARPDGARRGPSEFFDLLNAGKLGVALDLTTGSGRRSLQRLLASVDVVVIAARPRLGGRLDAMRDAVARLLGLDPLAVNVKASTGNLAGDDGAGRSIGARAVATVRSA